MGKYGWVGMCWNNRLIIECLQTLKHLLSLIQLIGPNGVYQVEVPFVESNSILFCEIAACLLVTTASVSYNTHSHVAGKG